jgi:hypothetical protein
MWNRFSRIELRAQNGVLTAPAQRFALVHLALHDQRLTFPLFASFRRVYRG